MNSIITNRLEIRKFHPKDKEAYVRIMTQSAVTKYLGSGTTMTEKNVENMLTSFQFSAGIFAVVERASSNVIGYCGIRPIPDGRIELLYAYDRATRFSISV